MSCSIFLTSDRHCGVRQAPTLQWLLLKLQPIKETDTVSLGNKRTAKTAKYKTETTYSFSTHFLVYVWYSVASVVSHSSWPHRLLPNPLLAELPRQEYGSGFLFPSLGHLPNPGISTHFINLPLDMPLTILIVMSWRHLKNSSCRKADLPFLLKSKE